MAHITLNDLTSNDFAVVETIQENFDLIENELNGNLDDTNISDSADIDSGKIENGGAVTQAELTETGEANKIPKLNSSGNLVITGKLVFLEGDI